MRGLASYDEPFAWWGSAWKPPRPRTVLDLIGDGTLSVELAGLLWALLARRASIVVAAGPSGAGKTTLLTALLDFLPADTRRLNLHGCYESFRFLGDPTVDPGRTVLLVNEISAHLPTYLWGPGVRRVLGAVGRGFGLAATAHAASVPDLVAALTGYPLRVPLAEVAGIDLVLVLEAEEEEGRHRRRVSGAWALSPVGVGGAGLTMASLPLVRHDISPKSLVAPLIATRPMKKRQADARPVTESEWVVEIDERIAVLTDLDGAPPGDPEAIRTALAAAAGRWALPSEPSER